MKKKLLIGAALILSVSTACTSGAGDWQSYSGDKRIEERVDSVLALMTLEEKIGQMTQYSAKSDIVTGPQVNTDIEPLFEERIHRQSFSMPLLLPPSVRHKRRH